MPTAYDELAYPSTVFRQTHPDRLATHAMLFGLPVAPITKCRVLDIGCGDGGNIIPAALAWPDAQFVGFDLAQSAIGRGRAIVESVGLRNVRLEVGDLEAADFGADGFDYVIAHGLYSWVPERARDALLASVRRHLAPNGVAFVSHNALPGAYLRQLVRDMMLFYVRGVEGKAARLAEARRRLEELVAAYPTDKLFERLVRVQCEEQLGRPHGVLAHDELGDEYHPVHLHEFLEHAGRHGLQFLTEAGAKESSEGFLPPSAEGRTDFDVPAHVQELDFKALRAYRENLLVRAEVDLDRRPVPSRLFGLYVAAPAAKAEGEDEGVFDVGTTRMRVMDAGLERVVERMGAAWPLALPVSDLIEDDEHAAAMLRLYWTGAIELHCEPSPFSVEVADRPQASPLARLQAARGDERVTTLGQAVMKVSDEIGRRFIAGLDGRRTIDEIAADMAREFGAPPDQLRVQVVSKLQELARMSLLV